MGHRQRSAWRELSFRTTQENRTKGMRPARPVHSADVMNYALSKMATMVKPTPITIPTEPIGRIPGPVAPMARVKKRDSEDRKIAPLYGLAVRDTMERFAGAGSPVVSDGEQRKQHNFCTYSAHGLSEHGTGWP